MLNVLNVDIYQDFVCPWCFVGTHRFGEALARIIHEGADFALCAS